MNLKKIKDSLASYEVVYKDPSDGKQKKETFSTKGAAEDFADNLAAGTFKINKVMDSEEIEVQGYDEICEAIEKELMNVNDLKFKVTGDEDLTGIEGDIEEFIDTLLADTGDTAKVTVVVDAPLVEVHWLIN